MSYLKKLGIYGIRSYGDRNTEQYEEITFFKPLTLILGNNGAGKSTIIESLKLITTGSFPPNSDKGKTFIKDPRLMGSNDSQGSISLIFKAINSKQILVRRLFQVKKDKNDKMTFDSKDATIKVRDKNTGKDISVDHKCLEIEKQIPQLLGVSKAVFENVIFCHQDESLWPFGDSATLKSIFDELFDTKQFTKLQESLQKQQKEIKKESSETKIHLQHYKQRYDEAVSLKQQIAKEAEDLLEETEHLEQMREDYKNYMDNTDDEMAVRVRIDDLNKETYNLIFKNDMMVKNQTSLLDSCTSHYFLDENVNTLKKLQEEVRDENRKLKGKKESLEEQIEIDRRELEKLKLEIEQLNNSDKNTKQIHQELKGIKQKLNEIMQKNIESEETILAEAKTYRENIEQEYKGKSFTLKNSIQDSQDDLTEAMQSLQSFQVKQVQLKESKNYAQKRITQLSEELKKLQQSNTQRELEELNGNLEAQKNNCDQFDQSIHTYQDQINTIKQQNIELSKQIGIINQQTAIRSKQLEFQQMTKQVEECNKTLQNLQKEYEKFNLSQDEHLNVQKKSCQFEISNLRQQNSKLESDISKLNGRLENLEDQETAYDQKINQITQRFKESSLLSIIASDNNADFDTKYNTLKEEIESLKSNIIEKETCLLIDKQVLKYCVDKKKCKFCKHDVNQVDLDKITKSQEERTKRAEKEIQEFINMKDQKIFEKDQLKNLKDQYEQFTEYKQKSKKNESEIKELQQQVKELSEKRENLVKQITQQESRLATFESATSVFNEILKTQRQLHESERKSQSFQKENPQLLDIDNQNIIPPEQIEEIHNTYKLNNQKLESLNSLLIKENNKKNGYQARYQQLVFQKETYTKKLKEEKGLTERNQQDISDYEKQQQSSVNELQSLQIKIEDINQLILELKKNQEEQSKQLQQVQQTYDQSKILIGEYLPKYELTYAQYKELKQAKGKQKLKVQENQLNQLQEKYTSKEKSKSENEQLLKEVIEQLIEQTAELDILIKGIQYLENQEVICQIQEELQQKQKSLKEQQANLEKVMYLAKSKNEQLQKIKSLEETCKYRKQALEKNYAETIAKYDQAEEKYCRTLVEQEVQNGLQKDIKEYLEELDKTLINYHKEKMQQINKCISDTWKGKDIMKVEIKAEEAEGRGKKIYNYRIVMFILDESDGSLKEIDMKGRCSAGQKVLASIIIRLALAEAFTMNCGILALDEPTTNLDKIHAQKLGEQLCELIESRKGQSSFQLIIISHDKDFINLMQQRQHCSDFYFISKVNGCSKIERRTYKNALLNKQTD